MSFTSVKGEAESEHPCSDHDSLFGDSCCGDEIALTIPVALRQPPPIPGLLVFPGLLPEREASRLWRALYENNMFAGGSRNQVMLFPSPQGDGGASGRDPGETGSSGLPDFLTSLEDDLGRLLHPLLEHEQYRTLLAPQPPMGRQIILNLYSAGQGISPHVDLPRRYADRIIGVCLGSGCVMDFVKQAADEHAESHSVYLPERTVYCITGEARWFWRHGIANRLYDRVADDEDDREEYRTIPRGTRVSVTLRWMKPGADVVGEEDQQVQGE